MLLVTHDSRFHYDEVLATAFLLQIYDDPEIIRTRDTGVIATADIVYDVGFEFNPKTNRYDHHMASFKEVFSSKYNIKLSSSGLIYKYFHKKLFESRGLLESDPLYQFIVEKVYEEFFLWEDAVDNGYDLDAKIPSRNISDLVREYNSETLGNDEQNRQFFKALEVVKADLENYMDNIFDRYIPKYRKLQGLLKNVESEIFVCPFIVSPDLVDTVGKNLGKDIKFLIHKSDENFKIVCLREHRDTFVSKLPLYKEWRGHRGEELFNISKIPGINFVHASGFCGSATNLDSAIYMCEFTIKMAKE